MSPPIFYFIGHLVKLVEDKSTGPIVCCWCNNQNNFIKYGTYQRYAFSTARRINIQRYLCKHDKCKRTFSILPHPFLRITRYSLCMLEQILKLFYQQIHIAKIARYLGLSWSTINRAIPKVIEILSWIEQEAKADPSWGPRPCFDPSRCWSEFIRMFAAKFYPKRYGTIPPTQYVY